MAAAAAVLAAGLAGQTPKAPPKSPAKSKPSSKTKKKTTSRAKSKKSAPRQTRPAPERYKAIEQELAARGYLRQEPSGNWTPGAVEALRSFQADRGLPATGKLDSLSLIELGLGPRPDKPAALPR